MNPSPLGDDNVLSEARPLPPAEAQLKMRLDIDMMSDALQRARDGLARDDAAQIDWMYVGGQMVRVVQYAARACEQCAAQDKGKEDAERPDTPLVGGILRDPFLPQSERRDDEGSQA